MTNKCLLFILLSVAGAAKAQLPPPFPVPVPGLQLDMGLAIMELQGKSPCLLAFAQSSRDPNLPFPSNLYCVLDRPVGNSPSCSLVGYDLASDLFTPLLPDGTPEVRVAKSCLEGGLEELLSARLSGGLSVRAMLHTHASVLYAGEQEFLDLFNEGWETQQGRPPVGQSAPPPLPDPNKKYTPVKVFYATDRKPTGMAHNVGPVFANDRSDGGVVRFGTAEVSIPKEHQKGQLEAPSVFRLEMGSNPDKHVSVLSVTQIPASEFTRELKNKVGKSRRKEAFVFIHGYNVTFEDGLRRTAQLTYDLNFDGAPILFSWPSGDKLWKYSVAEANVEWSMRHLQQFLLDVAKQSGAKQIHLIAHSMGNRALTNALAQLQAPQKLFQQIILAAPDVDTEVFGQIAALMPKMGERITIYASEKDEALRASQKFHSYRRLGQSGDAIFTSSHTDTVDASKLPGPMLGHSYFGDSEAVLSDLAILMSRGLAPERRPLLQAQRLRNSVYWQFKEGPSSVPAARPGIEPSRPGIDPR
jgi:esterase/lipase superfamily enzyme